MKAAEYYTPEMTCQMPLPLYVHSMSAGMESPAGNDETLDLNDYLVRHPGSCFYAQVQGDHLLEMGIFDGDLVLVDRQLKPQHGHLVLAGGAEGEFSCLLLDLKANCLRDCMNSEEAIALDGDAELRIEGVVLNSVRHHGRYL